MVGSYSILLGSEQDPLQGIGKVDRPAYILANAALRQVCEDADAPPLPEEVEWDIQRHPIGCKEGCLLMVVRGDHIAHTSYMPSTFPEIWLVALLRRRRQSAAHLRAAFRPEEGFNQVGRPTGCLRLAADSSVQADVPYLRLGAASIGRFR